MSSMSVCKGRLMILLSVRLSRKCKDLASATHRSSSKTEKLKKTALENGGIKNYKKIKFNFEMYRIYLYSFGKVQ